MIWVIIDTTHPAFRKSRLGGAWRVVCYVMYDPQTKQESLDWDLPAINSPVVGGAPGYGFHHLPGPSIE